MDKTYNFTVTKLEPRLDRFLAGKCPQLSRSYIQKLIGEGYVLVNSAIAKTSSKLEAGDRVDVVLPSRLPDPLLPEAIPLSIIFEDEDLLVIDKPAGLTVHPAPGHPGHTLVNAVLHHFPHLASVSDSLRPGVVHRLDKDTSGLLLLAKNDMARDNLLAQFKARTIAKAYLALVKGRLTPERGVIEAPIGRDPRNRKRMAVVVEGREARSEYRVVRNIGSFSLLEVIPETGRTHQIRVHLSAIGYPVVGDAVYGVKSAHISRQFLHACHLGFRLPSSGEYVEFTSELPPDLAQVLEALA